MTEPLWPPKPKLFDIVGPGVHGRGAPRTRSILRAGSSSVVPAVGGMSFFSNARRTAAASRAPAAPRA